MKLAKEAEEAISQGHLDHALMLYQRIPLAGMRFNDLLNRASVRIALNLDLDLAEKDLLEAEKRGCTNLHALNHNFGWLYSKQRKYKESIFKYTEALKINPISVKTLINRGSVYSLNLDANSALSDYHKAIEIEPENSMAYYNLGNIYKKLHRYQDAIEIYSKCLFYEPEHYDALNNLAGAYSSLGNLRKALEILSAICAKQKVPYEAYSNYLFALTHSDDHSPAKIFEEHVRIGKIIEGRVKNEFKINYRNSLKNSSKIKIGILSGDLRNHAVSNFFWKTFEALDKNRFEIYVFYNYFIEDQITQKYIEKSDFFFNIYGKPDQYIIDVISKSCLNILFDLSGHTGFSKLYLMSLRLAPIQISGIGYPGTSGIRAIDYYMHSADPDIWQAVSSQFIEKGIYSESSGSFTLKSDLPPLLPKPVLNNKFLTVGIFINGRKYNDSSWRYWTAVASKFNNLRFLFIGISDKTLEEEIKSKMEAAGIDISRLTIKPKLNYEDYLEAHNHVDILLDSCTYTGGTSAISAILMGTPLIGVVRNTLPGLSNLGTSRNYGITGNCSTSIDGALKIIDHFYKNHMIFCEMPFKMRTIAIKKIRHYVSDNNGKINNILEALVKKGPSV